MPDNNEQPTPALSRNASADYVAARWCMLSPHVREAVVTLVDAGLAEHDRRRRVAEAPEDDGDLLIEADSMDDLDVQLIDDLEVSAEELLEKPE